MPRPSLPAFSHSLRRSGCYPLMWASAQRRLRAQMTWAPRPFDRCAPQHPHHLSLAPCVLLRAHN